MPTITAICRRAMSTSTATRAFGFIADVPNITWGMGGFKVWFGPGVTDAGGPTISIHLLPPGFFLSER
jgi:hypothetical protein